MGYVTKNDRIAERVVYIKIFIKNKVQFHGFLYIAVFIVTVV